jgi:hypothetical protein
MMIAVQQAFERKVKLRFGECVISKTKVPEALTAVTISQDEDKIHDPDNGIVLRRDLAALFDAGLLGISGECVVTLAKRIRSAPQYQVFDNKILPEMRQLVPQAALGYLQQHCQRVVQTSE